MFYLLPDDIIKYFFTFCDTKTQTRLSYTEKRLQKFNIPNKLRRRIVKEKHRLTWSNGYTERQPGQYVRLTYVNDQLKFVLVSRAEGRRMLFDSLPVVLSYINVKWKEYLDIIASRYDDPNTRQCLSDCKQHDTDFERKLNENIFFIYSPERNDYMLLKDFLNGNVELMGKYLNSKPTVENCQLWSMDISGKKVKQEW